MNEKIQKPPNVVDLWQIAQELESKAKEFKPFERTVIFVGEPDSGKSSLISLLKGTLKEDPPKPTTALEYSYARRSNDSRREILHFYEMAGGKFSKDLTSVPLTLTNLAKATFVLCLDLSNPSNVLESLIFWFENIKEQYEKALQQESERNPSEIAKIRLSKQTEFENFPENESRKWMARILRFYCHSNSLSLYYSSIVNPKLMSQIKTILSGDLFGDTVQNVLQKDHMKPIFVSKGLDNIDSIGVTLVKFKVGNYSIVDLLRKISKEYFPQKQSDGQKTYANIDFSKYSEPIIDNTKNMKDKVLQKFLKKNRIESSENPISNYHDEPNNEDPLEEKSANFSNEKPSTIKPKTGTSTNPNNPQSFVKKYRPSLNKV